MIDIRRHRHLKSVCLQHALLAEGLQGVGGFVDLVRHDGFIDLTCSTVPYRSAHSSHITTNSQLKSDPHILYIKLYPIKNTSNMAMSIVSNPVTWQASDSLRKTSSLVVALPRFATMTICSLDIWFSESWNKACKLVEYQASPSGLC